MIEIFIYLIENMDLLPKVEMDHLEQEDSLENNNKDEIQMVIESDEDVPSQKEIPDDFCVPEERQVIPEENIFKKGPSVVPISDVPAPPVKKKRKATEKQLAHLAKIRQKTSDNKKLKDEVAQVKTIVNQGYTQDQLNHAIATALQSNEKQRKQRKEQKKKDKEQIEKDQKTISVISRAVSRNNPEDALWESCFTR